MNYAEMQDREYNRMVNWDCVPDGAMPYNSAADIERQRDYQAQARKFEVRIDEAAQILAKRVGGLVIQALLKGGNGMPLAHQHEFGFIEELVKECHSCIPVSKRHRDILNDMQEVVRRLKPMSLCTKHRGSNPALDALGIPYKGKRMVGGV